MLARRREAEIAIDLMKETYRRNVQDEENRKGLIICKAVYGRWLDLSHRDLSDAITDVTIPLQCLVKDSKLILHEASKVWASVSGFYNVRFLIMATLTLQCQLPGFYDPCMGEDKSLYVQYSFHGVPHEVTVQDSDPLRIPKQCKWRTLSRTFEGILVYSCLISFFFTAHRKQTWKWDDGTLDGLESWWGKFRMDRVSIQLMSCRLSFLFSVSCWLDVVKQNKIMTV